MTQDTPSVQADLAFLRGLVEEDWRPGVWAFGVVYLTIGACLVTHIALSWSVDAGLASLEGPALTAAYVAVYIPGSLVWFWISGRMRALKAARPSADVKGRAGASAFIGAILGHLVMLIVFVIVAVRQQNPIFLQLAPLVLFTLQAVTWFVAYAMRRQRWQAAMAWGWLAAVLALAPLVGTEAFGYGVAAVAIVLMIIPGAYMMRAARDAS